MNGNLNLNLLKIFTEGGLEFTECSSACDKKKKKKQPKIKADSLCFNFVITLAFQINNTT